MSFREWVNRLREEGNLVDAKRLLSRNLEAASLIKTLEPKPVFFHVDDSDMPVAANVCASRELIAKYLGIPPTQLVPKLLEAIEKPTKPSTDANPPFLETSQSRVDLDEIPLLYHAPKDGGRYISSAVVVARHPQVGQNVSFHRLMQISENELVIRIVPRHLDTMLEKTHGNLPIAICIGNPVNVLLAGACSVELGQDELEIANSLQPLKVAYCPEAECSVPAESEIVLVGRITDELHDEGPFIDLTETYDIVRQQRVVKITKIYHRNNPIYHALLPGGLEHKMLMGVPREPTIYKEVSRVCDCRDVLITPGGASWLHAVVQIRKATEEDGEKAIEAAFRGHTSLKHVIIVDEDIDITQPADVEWAFATRFQGDRDLVVRLGETGSSLDPSADPETRKTTKMGFDATKPLQTKGKKFEKEKLSGLDWRKFT